MQSVKSKLFLLDYEATIGPSIAILNKSIMESGFNIGVKSAESRKKRRDGALENNMGNIIESDSVDIKEKFLVEETSFNYGKDGVLTEFENSDQENTDDDILLDKPVVFSSPLKNLVNISVRKSFALNIGLDNVVKKSA
ncbi:hypothetical protein G9A89_008801 [Geosiphon pyriformis]|nr:hypothetical protein G9A89_008801 [Geosiphon pyriformis]